MATTITAAEFVSYLRDPEATEASVALVVSLANGLVSDELRDVKWQTEPWPTWVRILALGLAEAGWIKFSEESLDDWSGKRAAALAAMSLTDVDKNSLALLDGRVGSATGYSVKMVSPLDLP